MRGLCACGCGQRVSSNRAKYISGHNSRTRTKMSSKEKKMRKKAWKNSKRIPGAVYNKQNQRVPMKSFKAKCFRCLVYRDRKELHLIRMTGKYECKDRVVCMSATQEAANECHN